MSAAVSVATCHKASHSVAPVLAINKLNEGFTVQRANKEDLPAILAIYIVRAVEEAETVGGGGKGQTVSPIVAWGSFSDLYARPAYHISTEISIYLHQDYHGQGLGSLLTRWMLTQAPSLGIHNVVALIFAHNQPSLGLFRKLGFEQWGYMPKVCDMQGFIADVVMLGKAMMVANSDK